MPATGPADIVRHQIHTVLDTPRIADLVAAYFHPDGPFAGATFDTLGDNPPNEVTRDDLLAATLLDISWRPLAVRRLEAERDHVGVMLARIPLNRDLWEATPSELQAAEDPYRWLDGLPYVGATIASKLLARKRPRLVPIYDTVVQDLLTTPEDQFWTTLADALTDPGMRDDIERLRPTTAPTVSVLRLLDVAIWMRGSRSSTARAARAATGIDAVAAQARYAPGRLTESE
ncbi:DUF6308 family protein [Dactylosporangium sp. AC04546]|uniref:DUF6308 family protein n=1 Tax=Dactylosporangium sp. AC04546 TaxID=2862460 RepID=UPI001EDE688E|nr:DUF6308 family protein [Dactylosporangium sp. AC04546]WVK80480.1 DUF6308 family protein [Dactylosporangium sp. AC04546]